MVRAFYWCEYSCSTMTVKSKAKGGKSPSRASPQLGRPTDYTPELGIEICARMAEGKSLLQIMKDPDMPKSRATVYRWLEAHESFRDSYARAREMLGDHYRDEAIEIADKRPETTATEYGDRVDNGWVAHTAQRIDIRKWTSERILQGRSAGESQDRTPPTVIMQFLPKPDK